MAAAAAAAGMAGMCRCFGSRWPCCTRSQSGEAAASMKALRDCSSLAEGHLRGVVRDIVIAVKDRRRF
jgi:hypothetical protein